VCKANKVVYSAHEYPQDLADMPWLKDPSFPNNLRPLWDSFWGYIFRTQTAPLLIVKFGTYFAYPNDPEWLQILLNYMGGQLDSDWKSSLPTGQQGMS
jgi:endoglucanase